VFAPPPAVEKEKGSCQRWERESGRSERRVKRRGAGDGTGAGEGSLVVGVE
jgi:hypothetical protein